jgi:hypothetical protein
MRATDRLSQVEEQIRFLRDELSHLESQLNGISFREKFEKAKSCLRILYRDHVYTSRSAWVNEVLDDPEVQAWIREED